MSQIDVLGGGGRAFIKGGVGLEDPSSECLDGGGGGGAV